ncbi:MULTISPECIES: bifunctional lytic transglycosylase/C40 family peptidase [unclassified Crossiella]|uniref:C40 family peptidase n=1 Tax=unclassified Crossiella TaxID=2620835 RepID=UPI001FFF2C0B|nr:MULTISPECIES: bifunctional lytic transglycosylase/C40 family peptidase [unclassified Crossiella]MCK2243680.1 bifunctional lytic transglycosylase/C40 family peptidase [Crossiella sp. S99.2]MCK2257539.1 bifunctional lytic transglycosylase/C40 family peptidase [Crossiella sp. S99.1]
MPILASAATKIAMGATAVLAVPILFVAATIGALGGSQAQPGPDAVADIPTDYLGIYRTAAVTCPGLAWSVLAAVGKVETDHGRSTLPGVRTGFNPSGAAGPMQFLPATFTAYAHPVPPGGVDPPSPYHPVNAIHAAARMLCRNGAKDNHDIHAALFSYNHANWYVDKVLAVAASYSRSATTGSVVERVIAFAMSQIGQRYVWGGDGAHEGGFDCSGLTKAAYAAAGITLPRTAHTQYVAGPRLPPGAPLLPGDLVFFGNPHTKIHHVVLYVGDGKVVHAPTFGQRVQVARLASLGPYAGATRPSGSVAA